MVSDTIASTVNDIYSRCSRTCLPGTDYRATLFLLDVTKGVVSPCGRLLNLNYECRPRQRISLMTRLDFNFVRLTRASFLSLFPIVYTMQISKIDDNSQVNLLRHV